MTGHMPEYKMPLSSFLNDEADRGISLDEGQLQERSALFKKALHNASLPFATLSNSALMREPHNPKGSPYYQPRQ